MPFIFFGNISLPQTRFVMENPSRNWRRLNFWRVTQLQKQRNLVTGHTRTDSIERNLQALIRGTSPRGFAPSKVFNIKKPSNLFFSAIIFNPWFSYTFIIFESKIFLKKTEQNNFFFKKKKGIQAIQKRLNFQFLKKKQTNKTYPFFISPKLVRKNPDISNNNLPFYETDIGFLDPQHSFSFCFYSKSLQKKLYSLQY